VKTRMKKRKHNRQLSFDFHGIVNEDSCPLGFPAGSRLKGNCVPFGNSRAAIRPGQVVAISAGHGRTLARLYHPSMIDQVVAIVRAVFLPN